LPTLLGSARREKMTDDADIDDAFQEFFAALTALKDAYGDGFADGSNKNEAPGSSPGVLLFKQLDRVL